MTIDDRQEIARLHRIIDALSRSLVQAERCINEMELELAEKRLDSLILRRALDNSKAYKAWTP